MTKNEGFQKGGMRVIRRVLSLQLVVVYFGVLMLSASIWSWWHYAYNSPNRVFWSMVNNNLQTTSFNRTVVQDDGQQKITQVTYTGLGADSLSNSKTVIQQSGPTPAEVVTESVGTPSADYVRYTKVQTSQKNVSGNALDFSGIVNVWGKSEPNPDSTSGQQFNESALSVVPFGQLNREQRERLIRQMQNENVYSFSQVSRKKVGFGHTEYVYNVEIHPQAYIGMLKEYAKQVGLTQFESIEPSQYASTQPVTVQMTIDGWTHRLSTISFGEGSRVEQFSGYGSLVALNEPPVRTIPVEELQLKLQTIQ